LGAIVWGMVSTRIVTVNDNAVATSISSISHERYGDVTDAGANSDRGASGLLHSSIFQVLV